MDNIMINVSQFILENAGLFIGVAIVLGLAIGLFKYVKGLF
jgi:hypothetical protein